MCTIAKHESKCLRGRFRCPYHTLLNGDCDWVGSVNEVENHINTKHTPTQKVTRGLISNIRRDSHLTNFSVTLPYETLTSNAECCEQVWTVSGLLFLFVCTVRNDVLYACVTYVGDRTDACKYEYSVMITKQSGESVTQCLASYSCLDNLEDLICKGYCAAFHRDLAKECLIANGKLTLAVKIKLA